MEEWGQDTMDVVGPQYSNLATSLEQVSSALSGSSSTGALITMLEQTANAMAMLAQTLSSSSGTPALHASDSMTDGSSPFDDPYPLQPIEEELFSDVIDGFEDDADIFRAESPPATVDVPMMSSAPVSPVRAKKRHTTVRRCEFSTVTTAWKPKRGRAARPVMATPQPAKTYTFGATPQITSQKKSTLTIPRMRVYGVIGPTGRLMTTEYRNTRVPRGPVQ